MNHIISHDLFQKYYVFSGMAFGKLHRIDSALYYYRQAEQANDRENPYSNWIVYVQIGLMFQDADNFPEAEKYFSKAYDLTKNKGIRVDYGIVLFRFADFYYQWGDAEKFSVLVNEQEKFVQSGKRNYTDPVHRMLYVDWKKKTFDEKLLSWKR